MIDVSLELSAAITPDRHADRQGWHRAGPAIAAALLALALYAISLGGTYIYDDAAIIKLDPRISHPGLWGQYWTHDYFYGGLDNLYRPLVSMSYAIPWWLHGDRPWAYHAVNWLLHAVVSAMVAEFTRRAVGRAPAYVAGLLFAAHPVHVEAVANVVGRAELMCTLGLLGALLLMSRRPLTGWRVAGILACEALSVLSKEQGTLMPVVLALYGWFVWRREGAPDPRERKAVVWLAVLVIWCTAGYLIAREQFLRFEWDRGFLDWLMQPMVRSTGRDRALMPIVLLGHYMELLVFPTKLSLDYGAKVVGWTVRLSDPYFWIGVTATIGWTVATVAAVVRRNGFAAFCLLALGFSYGMTGNVIALVGANMAERWMYLPSAFFVMFVALLITRLPRVPRAALVVVLLALASLRTVTYALRWNDPLTLYTRTLAEQPMSGQLHLLAANEYAARGMYKEADDVMRDATERFPDSWHVWMRWGAIVMDQGRYDEAAAYLDRAFHISPNPLVIMYGQRLEAKKSAAQAAATQTTTTRP